ncbi:MAG: aldo/keto reductase [Cyanobacteria bacterium P01_A01_bin.17]
MMQKTLGKSGPEVTAIGIGTWSWGDRVFWGYGNQYDAADVETAFHAAVEAGITLFDTAEVYGLGESERLLGRFSQSHSVQIATKYGPLPWRLTGQSVTDALQDSLKRLQASRIALYQVHWPFNFLMSSESLFSALAQAVSDGLIETVGVSNYSAAQMTEAHQILARHGVPLAVNQVRYALVNRQIEQNGILEAARQLGVTILAYSPLAQGLLTGKYAAGAKPDGARQLDSRFSAQGLTKLAPVTQLLQQYADHHGRTMAQVALNWLIHQEGVIAIPGAKTAKQARDNAGAMGWSLTEQEYSELERVSRPWLQ